MGVLGGAGTHALVGMRVWSRSLGLVASVGRDVPETVYRQPLEALGYVDLRAIVRRENYQTARAWQLFEKDGTRTEVMRTDPAEFLDNTPRHEEMPDDYRNAKGFHVLWGRDLDELGSLLAKLRKGNPSTCLLWEPSPDHERGTPDQYIDILKQVDVFSPDIQQATLKMLLKSRPYLYSGVLGPSPSGGEIKAPTWQRAMDKHGTFRLWRKRLWMLPAQVMHIAVVCYGVLQRHWMLGMQRSEPR